MLVLWEKISNLDKNQKMDKPLARLPSNKERRNKITNIRNEMGHH